MIYVRIYKVKKRETSNSGEKKKVYKKAIHGQRKLDAQTL